LTESQFSIVSGDEPASSCSNPTLKISARICRTLSGEYVFISLILLRQPSIESIRDKRRAQPLGQSPRNWRRRARQADESHAPGKSLLLPHSFWSAGKCLVNASGSM